MRYVSPLPAVTTYSVAIAVPISAGGLALACQPPTAPSDKPVADTAEGN